MSSHVDTSTSVSKGSIAPSQGQSSAANTQYNDTVHAASTSPENIPIVILIQGPPAAGKVRIGDLLSRCINRVSTKSFHSDIIGLVDKTIVRQDGDKDKTSFNHHYRKGIRQSLFASILAHPGRPKTYIFTETNFIDNESEDPEVMKNRSEKLKTTDEYLNFVNSLEDGRLVVVTLSCDEKENINRLHQRVPTGAKKRKPDKVREWRRDKKPHSFGTTAHTEFPMDTTGMTAEETCNALVDELSSRGLVSATNSHPLTIVRGTRDDRIEDRADWMGW